MLPQEEPVGAVLTVDGDAAAERYVAHDLISGDRSAALGKTQHHVLHAFHLDPVLIAGLRRTPPRTPHSEQLCGARLAVGGLGLLQGLAHLVATALRRDL